MDSQVAEDQVNEARISRAPRCAIVAGGGLRKLFLRYGWFLICGWCCRAVGEGGWRGHCRKIREPLGNYLCEAPVMLSERSSLCWLFVNCYLDCWTCESEASVQRLDILGKP